MKKIWFSLLSISMLLLTSCEEDAPTAEEIIAKSITAHGADVAANATLDFTFRGIKYKVDRYGGRYTYEREFTKGNDLVKDQLNNDGFTRSISDSIVSLPDSLRSRYSASLNSVVYFAQLPYSLDGDAVILENLGTDQINDQEYYQIKVTFKEDGGGEDHEDEFIYWIDTTDFLVDYLAYSYCEDDCGFRFRESVNRRTIDGIVIQDYNNYRSSNSDPTLEDLDTAFEAGQLVLMSEIKTEFPEVAIKSAP
ncbi:DUF6503 family protein [Nonlabens agnitus]|uniref:Deoxyribose-phosphate aldolase n=1 Tax=Nonlabens agnitus TaxID=870484 RepID=A0A2S9WS50_9FLAO|nr:DUF6503 family protein [Nonlabens agnitus]PRP66305.1 hypothetical protein BST86_03965 [Nonlabens agnitus]